MHVGLCKGNLNNELESRQELFGRENYASIPILLHVKLPPQSSTMQLDFVHSQNFLFRRESCASRTPIALFKFPPPKFKQCNSISSIHSFLFSRESCEWGREIETMNWSRDKNSSEEKTVHREILFHVGLGGESPTMQLDFSIHSLLFPRESCEWTTPIALFQLSLSKPNMQ